MKVVGNPGILARIPGFISTVINEGCPTGKERDEERRPRG